MIPAWLAPYWRGFRLTTSGCGWELDVQLGPAGLLVETSRLPAAVDDGGSPDRPRIGFRPPTEAQP